MTELLQACQIPANLHDSFLLVSVQEFGVVAIDLSDLDNFISDLSVEAEPPRALQVARVRLLWQKCCQASTLNP